MPYIHSWTPLVESICSDPNAARLQTTASRSFEFWNCMKCLTKMKKLEALSFHACRKFIARIFI